MDFEDRLLKVERRQRGLLGVLSLATAILAVLCAYQAYSLHAFQTASSLRVRELRVYDAKGVDRVVISGHLPQPTLDGKPHYTKPRSMAGMLIYDESATERGGYGTADGYANAMLTLDAKGRQVMLMMAEPDGGPFFRQWDGASSVTLGVSDAPFITLKDGPQVVFAKPEANPWVTRSMR